MRSWLQGFRERLEEAVHGLLWKQWSLLGVSATAPPEDRWLADPEALTLFTLEAARSEPRLFDEVLDWLVTNGASLDIQRLKNICDRDAGFPRNILRSVARILSERTPPENGVAWLGWKSKEPGTRNISSSRGTRGSP